MSLCKHPDEVCCNMTLYHGKVYCDDIDGFCHLHDEPPPPTNADHIRSMTDEELAKRCSHTCPPGDKWKSCDGCDSGEVDECEKCWLDWLKQPCGGE